MVRTEIMVWVGILLRLGSGSGLEFGLLIGLELRLECIPNI